MKIQTLHRLLAVMFFATIAFLIVPDALAQTTTADASAPAVGAPVPAGLPTSDGIVAAVAAVLSPLLVALAKKYLPSLPSWAPPLLSTVFGLAITLINSFVAGHSALPWWAGAALGVLGVGLREVKENVLPAENAGWGTTPAPSP